MIIEKLILDTCIMIDSFDESSKYHLECNRILEIISRHEITNYAPTHSVIEMSCALKRLKFLGKSTGKWIFNSPENGFKSINVDINMDFLFEWFDPKLPYIKSGDYIFMCIANKLKIPLITNDKKLIKSCQGAGIIAYNSKKLLNILEEQIQ